MGLTIQLKNINITKIYYKGGIVFERRLIQCSGICEKCNHKNICPEEIKNIFRNTSLEISILMEEFLEDTNFIDNENISIDNIITTIQVLEEDNKESLQIIKDSLKALSYESIEKIKERHPEDIENIYNLLIRYMAMKIFMVATNTQCRSERKNCYKCFVSEKCQFAKKE